ncbi:MAG: hypothetical protein SGBAC_008834 [Bacillariaceae sp.]
MSRHLSLFLSLTVISALCCRPTQGLDLRQSCRLNTHRNLNTRSDTSHCHFVDATARDQRLLQYTYGYPGTSLYAQPDGPCSDDDHEENALDEANNMPTTSRRQRLRKRLKRFGKTLFLASTLSFVAMPKPAEAKFAHEIAEERVFSLRPGVSQDQATQMSEGEIPDDLPEQTGFSPNKEATEASDARKKKEFSKNSYDYGDEDDDDYDLEDEYFLQEQGKGSRSSPGRKATSQSDSKRAMAFQAGTKSSFSGVGTKSEGQKRTQTVKVAVGAFIPTFGAMFLREFVRRRKEENYVKKGLEILKVQKAEYFNITESTADSDIEDELKDLKDDDEDDKDDDDDDDDEDDDEDDDDEDDDEDDAPASRRRPKRPTGGGDSGDGSSGGSGDGDDRPSADDLKRLGDIFDKS